jgi:hypothetical protein
MFPHSEQGLFKLQGMWPTLLQGMYLVTLRDEMQKENQGRERMLRKKND